MKFNTKFVLTYIILSIAYLIVAGSFVSCSMTPKRQAFISVQAATDAVNTVSDAYEAKLISKSQLNALLPYADAVKSAQDKLLQAQLDKVSDLTAYWQALSEAVLNLLNKKSELKNL